MIVDELRAVLARISKLFVVSLAVAGLAVPAAHAQDDDTDAPESDEPVPEVVVTGSRIKRDTYTSIAPLQVISAQVSREVGLIDAADILQESSAASGLQIDLTFQGFRLDNGPGSSTLDLRGLGESRTLVLVNGKRMAPGGVEGAPFAADLNLIPSSLVQQYDLLLDGASSVYGSDAIAGVANVILRKDFDGIEIEGFTNVPHHSGGVGNTLSLVWGKNFDRGFVGFGAEYAHRDSVAFDDRPWTEGCDKHHELDENGKVRSQERYYNNVLNMEWDECRIGLLVSRVSVPFAGSIYYTPGFSNGGWGEFSESSRRGIGIDSNGDGVADLSFRDYSLNGKRDAQQADLFAEVETAGFMGYGEYTIDSAANITPYFELLYSRRDFDASDQPGQIFETVPANNPFNICNPNQPNGVDCGDAMDTFLLSPTWVAEFQGLFGDFCAANGVPLVDCNPATFGLTSGPIGPASTVPIVSVRGHTNDTKTTIDQTRMVLGVRGDMPFMSAGSLDNWSFDVFASHSQSSGDSRRYGIREDRWNLAVGTFSSTNTPCENDLGVGLEADAAPGCVPVNMFAPSLYPRGGDSVVGDFETQAERDYLFDNRDFDTEVKQSIVSGYATGEVFSMPGGAASFGIGFEWRKDEIDSKPDAVAREGLLINFFSDGGAVGETTIKELFAELELPMFAGNAGMRELTFNLSTRVTDHEYYGQNWTGSVKMGYRPVDSLLIRATYGTAFRAPNLRELFLLSQTGFNNISDPCFIPEEALDSITGDYDPTLDNRDPIVLQNCALNGVDPTRANNNGFNTYGVEQAAGGSLELDPETSESWSAGFAWDQNLTNAFDMTIGATYYEIEINDTILEPGGQFIVDDCYNNVRSASVFCSRITRDADPDQPFINLLDRGFINRDAEVARGVDVNLAMDATFTVFERPIDFGLDIVANRTIERTSLFVDGFGNEDFDEFQGEWVFPDWRGNAIMRFDYDELRFTYEMRYIGSQKQDPAGVDPFDEAITGISDTCDGPPDDVLCRDLADLDNYFQHSVSLYWRGDRWTVGGGIRNLTDASPPRVDSNESSVFVNRTPLGFGYDLMGRTYFANVAVNLDF